MADIPDTLDEIVAATMRAAQVSRDVLLGPQTRRPLPAFRHAAIFLAYGSGRWSSSQIGRAFNRDHTTVFYAFRKGAERHAETAAIRAALADG